jgi:glycosyltransferase involved in cell wall biosynthesis
MSIKILHIPAYALHGGCEKNCYHFIKNSPQFQHDVLVLGKEGPMSKVWLELGVSVEHLDIIEKGLFDFLDKLRAHISGSSYDLAICWSTIRLPFQLRAMNGVARNAKVYLGNPVGQNYNPWKDIVLSKIFRHRFDVKLMACSEYVAASYRKSPYFSSYPIEVSLNPVAIPDSPRKEPQGEKFVMGMVARLDPIKDHATVIRAFKKVHEQNQATELHLVGDGKLRSDLEGLANSLGIASSVVFHGDVSDVYSILRAWNLFVYATTPDEGLGSAVAEAMANGLPCVLSDLPMLRELAPGNLASWFTPFNSGDLGDKVIQLMSDHDGRKKSGERSYLHAAKEFTAKRFIDNYVDDLSIHE